MEFDRFTHERERLAKGCERIAGVDEAGRGPLAGPVSRYLGCCRTKTDEEVGMEG